MTELSLREAPTIDTGERGQEAAASSDKWAYGQDLGEPN